MLLPHSVHCRKLYIICMRLIQLPILSGGNEIVLKISIWLLINSPIDYCHKPAKYKKTREKNTKIVPVEFNNFSPICIIISNCTIELFKFDFLLVPRLVHGTTTNKGYPIMWEWVVYQVRKVHKLNYAAVGQHR